MSGPSNGDSKLISCHTLWLQRDEVSFRGQHARRVLDPGHQHVNSMKHSFIKIIQLSSHLLCKQWCCRSLPEPSTAHAGSSQGTLTFLIHTKGNFESWNNLNMDVFGLWGETGLPRENLHTHRENMQIPHRKAFSQERRDRPHDFYLFFFSSTSVNMEKAVANQSLLTSTHLICLSVCLCLYIYRYKSL